MIYYAWQLVGIVCGSYLVVFVLLPLIRRSSFLHAYQPAVILHLSLRWVAWLLVVIVCGGYLVLFFIGLDSSLVISTCCFNLPSFCISPCVSVRFYLMSFDFSPLSLSCPQLFPDACRHADHSSCLILVRCCAEGNIKSEPAFLGKVGS